MCKSFFAVLTFIFITFSNITFAQDDFTIQINGGVIIPMSSSNGLTTSIQFNYSFNPNIQFYIYSGYSSWNKYKVVFHEDYSTVQKQQLFNSYSSDDHILIPIYIGSRIDFHTNKLFASFANVEIGYSHLSYNTYENVKEVNQETGEVLSYNADKSTRKEINENLLGIGIGAGLSHPITENINLILSFKLNSHVNSKYYGLFSNRGIYTAFIAGFNFNI